ncbi:MAG: hypothetical protein ACKO34_00835 [Vampirovibrionales bacterium]
MHHTKPMIFCMTLALFASLIVAPGAMAARLIEYDEPPVMGYEPPTSAGESSPEGRDFVRPYNEQEEEVHATYGQPHPPADQRSLRELINEERNKMTGGSMETEFPTADAPTSMRSSVEVPPTQERPQRLPRERKPQSHGEFKSTLFSPWKEMRPLDANNSFFN